MKNEFGTYLNLLRIKYGISVRELGIKIGVSFSHLSNVENGNRKPFSYEKILLISNVLELTEFEEQHLMNLSDKSIKLFNDLKDIQTYMISNPKSIETIKCARDLGYGNVYWQKIIDDISK